MKTIYLKRLTKDHKPKVIARFKEHQKFEANKLLQEYQWNDSKNDYTIEVK